MYCNYNVNNCCKCRCKNYVESTSVRLEDSLLKIEIPKKILCNKQIVCVKIIQPIPEGATGEIPVVIVVNGVEYNVLNKCGNFVYADQIQRCKMYSFRFATDTTYFVYCGGFRLCPTRHNFNCIEPQAPEEAAMLMRAVKPKQIKEVKNVHKKDIE